jgi:hypothetical protein
MSHIISLMPAGLATLVELFEYKGNRHLGLSLLQVGRFWFGLAEEGVRRRRGICDMWLLIDLIFHLFLSSFTHDGVDVMMAQKIVDENLKRCPEGKMIAW